MARPGKRGARGKGVFLVVLSLLLAWLVMLPWILVVEEDLELRPLPLPVDPAPVP